MNVSVIIPAYNEESYIAESLKSILNQSKKPYEVIVVNNNSTDRTREIAEQFNVKVIDEEKQGMIFARNRGFNEASGDILARTDADTEVSPDWIENIQDDFEKHPKIVALTGPAEYGSSLSTWVTRTYLHINKVVLHHETLYGPNMAIKKELWDQIKQKVCIDDTLVHEDIDLSIHAAKYGKIYYDPKLIVKTSARRVKNPGSFLFDYIPRWKTTIQQH